MRCFLSDFMFFEHSHHSGINLIACWICWIPGCVLGAVWAECGWQQEPQAATGDDPEKELGRFANFPAWCFGDPMGGQYAQTLGCITVHVYVEHWIMTHQGRILCQTYRVQYGSNRYLISWLAMFGSTLSTLFQLCSCVAQIWAIAESCRRRSSEHCPALGIWWMILVSLVSLRLWKTKTTRHSGLGSWSRG